MMHIIFNYNEIDISFKEIKGLLNIADEILKSICKDVLNTELMTDAVKFVRERFSILKLLAKAKKERQIEICEKYLKIGQSKSSQKQEITVSHDLKHT